VVTEAALAARLLAERAVMAAQCHLWLEVLPAAVLRSLTQHRLRRAAMRHRAVCRCLDGSSPRAAVVVVARRLRPAQVRWGLLAALKQDHDRLKQQVAAQQGKTARSPLAAAARAESASSASPALAAATRATPRRPAATQRATALEAVAAAAMERAATVRTDTFR
jgi:hypothetical protein